MDWISPCTVLVLRLQSTSENYILEEIVGFIRNSHRGFKIFDLELNFNGFNKRLGFLARCEDEHILKC